MGDVRLLALKWEATGMGKARVLLIGAGVNGSICATALYDGGVDVTVLARGRRYEELRNQGIVIEHPFKHTRTVTPVPVIAQLNADDVYDYVLVVVRKNQALDLLPLLAQNRSPNVVFMGNNVSGPQEFVDALGKERVMMGSVWGAGKRDGGVIRAIAFKSAGSPIGEIDGTITPRLERLAAIFRRGGLRAKLSSNIVDSQMTHGVGVALIGRLVMSHGGDVKSLARSRDDLLLFVQGRREGYHAMRTLGHQVIPRSEGALTAFPGLAQVVGLRALLSSRLGEVGLAWHVSQAPDEIRQLAGELRALVEQAGIAAPAIRQVLGPDERGATVP